MQGLIWTGGFLKDDKFQVILEEMKENKIEEGGKIGDAISIINQRDSSIMTNIAEMVSPVSSPSTTIKKYQLPKRPGEFGPRELPLPEASSDGVSD
jgi:hypothetical protein